MEKSAWKDNNSLRERVTGLAGQGRSLAVEVQGRSWTEAGQKRGGLSPPPLPAALANLPSSTALRTQSRQPPTATAWSAPPSPQSPDLTPGEAD